MSVDVLFGQVRYVVATPEYVGAVGDQGIEFVLARDGVYKQARRVWDGGALTARVQVARADLPGLSALASFVVLEPRLPAWVLDNALRRLAEVSGDEAFHEGLVQIARLSDCWKISAPTQDGSVGRVQYEVAEEPGLVLELHSHPGGPTVQFSGTDDLDEQGFRLYGVVGDVHGRLGGPAVQLRVGVYGAYLPVFLSGVLDGVSPVLDLVSEESFAGLLSVPEDKRRPPPTSTTRRFFWWMR